ncbi:MAG: acetyl-CoA hydrolase/transferase C-terminal domain-containing protein [Ketobacter sp.]
MSTVHLDNVEACVDHIIASVGNDIRIGLPLGMGKPPELTNALYQRVKGNPELSLTIATALTLEVPEPGEGIQKRFIGPFLARVFGDYAGFDYMRDLREGTVPDNIQVHEFFFKSGAMLNIDEAQQNYICTNYTHSVRDILNMGINVVAQMLGHRIRNGKSEYSMSCNPETTLDLLPRLLERKQQGEAIVIIGQVNEQLPFMVNDAIVDDTVLDVLVTNKQYNTTLFAPPNMPISTVDYMVGIHASTLIPDGGTLQLGIGSLCDAIAYGCDLRQNHCGHYKQLLSDIGATQRFGKLIDSIGGTGPFEHGLYGCSEMFVNAFYQLMRLNILRREVYDHEGLQRLLNQKKLNKTINSDDLFTLLEAGVIREKLSQQDLEFLLQFGFFKPGTRIQGDSIIPPHGEPIPNHLTQNHAAIARSCLGTQLLQARILHGGFFLGPPSFYQALRDLDDDSRNSINMTRISYMNALYGNEELKRLQRTNARFINTVFLAHALGAATSDGLDNGKVVSGVGGQYNFVAQAHELEDARSILMLKSTKEKSGTTRSNIVWNYGHTTIPRHLRDIYITEYGIADTRGKCDKEVAAAMVNIADSRFQAQLVASAVNSGKLPGNYQIPQAFRSNYPDKLEKMIQPYRDKHLFPAFPFGSDFTETELVVVQCLKAMQSKMSRKSNIFRAILRSVKNKQVPEHFTPYLQRVELDQPATIEDKIARAMMIKELENLKL